MATRLVKAATRPTLRSIFQQEGAALLRQPSGGSGDLIDGHGRLCGHQLLHQVLKERDVLFGDHRGQCRLELGDPQLIDLLRRRTLDHFDGLLRGPFDQPQLVALATGQEHNRMSHAARPPCASDAMDVGFAVVRQIEIKDVTDSRHVQAPRGHIRRHDDIQRTIAQLLDGSFTDLLRHVAVQGRGLVTLGYQVLRDRNRGFFGFGKYDHPIGGLDFQKASQHIQFIGDADKYRPLRDRLGGHRFLFDRDLDRVAQIPLGNLADRGRQRGGEQRDLTLLGHLLQDKLDVFQEAHVQHLVGFVQDQAFDLAQVQAAAVDVVDDSTWRADHDLRIAMQLSELHFIILTAVDGRQVQALQVPPVLLERRRNLHGQFAGRRQDQHLGLAARGDFNFGQHGQSKRGRLATAGLRLGQHVAAVEHVGNDLGLDGRRLYITGIQDGLLDLAADFQISK